MRDPAGACRRERVARVAPEEPDTLPACHVAMKRGPSEGMDMICLDLGASARSPEGYVPLGNLHGTPVNRLAYADGTVDVVRASHVLEHFPRAEIAATVAEWVRVLKPGGVLRIAVPDFATVAKNYLEGVNQPTEGYVLGGQVDKYDYHKALFDESTLKRTMAAAGLVLIRRWTSELDDDCAALPISLNLEGTKPHQAELGVAAIMSVPRLGFMDNFCAAQEGLRPIGSRLRIVQGAYWGQCLERGIESTLEEQQPDAILTLDYDTVFASSDVALLVQLMMAHPEADAIAAVQAGRGKPQGALFTMNRPAGEASNAGVRVRASETFAPDLAKVATAHFGLTLIRADRLRELPKPWFLDKPDAEGGWGDGRVDADIGFWRKWEAAGFALYLANRVPIGHLQLGVLWPGRDLNPIFQPSNEWREKGKPEGCWT
jgi:hypothetical protein